MWREDGENGEAARAQNGFYGLASATRDYPRGWKKKKKKWLLFMRPSTRKCRIHMQVKTDEYG